MTVSKKIKTIDNKIKQNKAQYNWDRQVANISALSSGNVGKYKFLNWEYALPEKGLIEKAATIQRFEYLVLYNELLETHFNQYMSFSFSEIKNQTLNMILKIYSLMVIAIILGIKN